MAKKDGVDGGNAGGGWEGGEGERGTVVEVMQEQKAENTGRQFCSCFYQLLGIGGSGPTMPGRILGGSCGNVRLFSVLPLLPLVRPGSVPFYPRSFSRDPSLALADGSSFPAWLSFFLRSPARRLVSLPFVLPTLSASPPPLLLLPPRPASSASSSSYGCLGYQGSSRSPSTVHSATWCALYLRTVRAP